MSDIIAFVSPWCFLSVLIVIVAGWHAHRRAVRSMLAKQEAAAGDAGYALLASVAADAIITIDDANRILAWNRGAEIIFGHDEMTMVGQPLENIIPERYRDLHRAGIRRVCRSGTMPLDGKTRQMFALRRDGSEFPIELTVSTLATAQGRLFVGIIRDITERRRIEDSLRRAKGEAEDAASAKSKLLATVSHEIRTPLNGIIGLLQLLRESRLDAGQQDWVETMHYSSQGLMAILDDLLDYSKLEAGRLQLEHVDFNLWRLGSSIISLMMSRASEKGLTLSGQPNEGVPCHLRGDPTRLRQVLLNLVSNAIKFTERGLVTMGVTLVGQAGKDVRLRFTVTDTGIGIAEEARSRLFTPFGQADASVSRRFGGTGLGLTICKTIVDTMGGRIGVDSRVGKGSSFWFEVPFELSPVVRSTLAAGMESVATPVEQVAPRILLAEDNEINQKVAVALLRDVGMNVDFAGDGRLAVAKLLGGQVRYDAVLMDLQMPGLNGIEATRRIRERLGDRLPIIGMTAHVQPEDLDRCMAAGMDEVVTKPVDPARLYEALHRRTGLPVARGARLDAVPPDRRDRAEISLPEALPPFDLQAALRRLNGNRKLLRELIVGFHAHYAGTMAELRHLLDHDRRVEAYRLVHTLRAVAGTIECATLFAAAGAVEAAIRDGSAELPVHLGALDQALAPALAGAASLVGGERVGRLAGGTGLRDDIAPSGPGKEAVILIVDDDPTNIRLLHSFLQAEYETIFTTDSGRALELARDVQPDLILLDVMMPGADGYDICSQCKADEATAHIPVIFVTSLSDVEAEIRGLAAGAADYVTKPISPPIVRMRVRHQIDLKQARDRLTLLAEVDGLTGLANRRRFNEVLQRELRRLQRSGSPLSLALLDVDFFKAFNDSYGHVAGDDCLRRIGQVLAAEVSRSADLTARYGGEEFAIVLPDTDRAGAEALAERIRLAIGRLGIPHKASCVTDHVTVSIGVLTADGQSPVSAPAILEQVDAQLYKAKHGGRDRVCACRLPSCRPVAGALPVEASP